MTVIKHFLLVFDHAQDKLLESRDFGSDSAAATAAYTEAEKRFWGDLTKDIVLVGSDSIETVKVTHSNYFEGMAKKNLAHLLQPLG